MIKTISLSCFSLLITALAVLKMEGQPLEVFQPLMDKVWRAEGNWGDGSSFKQEITFRYDFNRQLVITETKGFIDADKTEYGLRSHGIRQFNASTGKIHFWEFDIFGEAIEGTVLRMNQDIILTYEYQGTLITDYWKYIDEYTYGFTIGSYANGSWSNKYLETTFQADIPLDHFINQLEGRWITPAWDGQLKEEWSRDPDHKLIQSQEYWENGQMTYAATSYIQQVDETIILVSIIKDGNPKIFKATDISSTKIVFENSDYSNPSKVVYTFHPNGFNRTIIGTENNEPTSYTFKFKAATD